MRIQFRATLRETKTVYKEAENAIVVTLKADLDLDSVNLHNLARLCSKRVEMTVDDGQIDMFAEGEIVPENAQEEQLQALMVRR